MVGRIIRGYLQSLYARTMREAYGFALQTVAAVDGPSPRIIDFGCNTGRDMARIREMSGRPDARFLGVEWSARSVAEGLANGHDIVQADLNRPIPVESESQDCGYALSVLEHLLMPCAFLKECHRILRPGGKLVLLTPNISTYFTAALILAGRMPSTGPHPDSNALMAHEELVRVTRNEAQDVEEEHPEHRHLVVFSFLALRKFLRIAGFSIESGRGFGLYPLPNFVQPLFERIDPYHCHQMVFVCRKTSGGPATR